MSGSGWYRRMFSDVMAGLWLVQARRMFSDVMAGLWLVQA